MHYYENGVPEFFNSLEIVLSELPLIGVAGIPSTIGDMGR